MQHLHSHPLPLFLAYSSLITQRLDLRLYTTKQYMRTAGVYLHAFLVLDVDGSRYIHSTAASLQQ
jgi:hypothetical protein